MNKICDTATVKRLPVVGIVVPALTTGGGVPAVAKFLADTAIRSGRYQVRLISLATSASDQQSMRLLSPETWREGVRTQRGMWNGYEYVHIGSLFAEIEFVRYAKRAALVRELASCDLVQVVSGFPAWANPVTDYGIPVALQCATLARVERRMRDSGPTNLLGMWRRAMTAVTNTLDRAALCAVQVVQVENPWMLSHVQAHTKNSRTQVIYAPPGVDADVFVPGHRPVSTEGYILCVGRLADPRKNVGLLLEAYSLLDQQVRVAVKLVLAGSSAPPKAFWDRVVALGLKDRVTFVQEPTRQELINLYQAALLFALPSDEEGLGIVLLEAMACGRPVVSTRSGGPEGIIEDGYDGYLVALNDATSMAQRINELLLDSEIRARMGAAGRRKVEERYSLDSAGAAFLRVWDSMLGAMPT